MSQVETLNFLCVDDNFVFVFWFLKRKLINSIYLSINGPVYSPHIFTIDSIVRLWFFVAAFKHLLCSTFGLINRNKSAEYAYIERCERMKINGKRVWSVCETLKYELKSTHYRFCHGFISILITCVVHQHKDDEKMKTTKRFCILIFRNIETFSLCLSIKYS